MLGTTVPFGTTEVVVVEPEAWAQAVRDTAAGQRAWER